MNQTKNKAVSVCMPCLLLLMLIQSGCIAASYMKDEPGKDVGAVMLGSNRSEAEKVLGEPVRQWDTPLKIHYCVYRYDAGIPSNVGDALAVGFFEVLSVGLWDLIETMSGFFERSRQQGRKYEQIAIAYDSNSTIVGIFDHFGDLDQLPDSGIRDKSDK